MRNARLYTHTGVVALIGALAICLLSSCAEDSSDWEVTDTIPAPNGEYVATIYRVMGGGAAGWCGQRIEINSRNQPFDLERAKEGADYCFSASCGSDIEIVWEPDGSALRITYTIGVAGVSTYQRRMAPGLPVRIDYGTK